MYKGKTRWLVICLCAVLSISSVVPAFAQTLQSNSYQFDESALGQGGLPESTSANYQASSSTGDLGVGESSSANYGVEGGSQTSPDPRLTVTVNDGSVDLSDFSFTTPSMGTSTFSVINYTSYGYIVIITGDPPTNDGYSLTPLATPTASSTGNEQFGINMVANTAPQTIGADPSHGFFAFGDAQTDYDTPNVYKYGNGDVIASATKSSGETQYTITYLVNAAQLTPGGRYTTNNSIVVVGTY